MLLNDIRYNPTQMNGLCHGYGTHVLYGSLQTRITDQHCLELEVPNVCLDKLR